MPRFTRILVEKVLIGIVDQSSENKNENVSETMNALENIDQIIEELVIKTKIKETTKQGSQPELTQGTQYEVDEIRWDVLLDW